MDQIFNYLIISRMMNLNYLGKLCRDVCRAGVLRVCSVHLPVKRHCRVHLAHMRSCHVLLQG
jgi:hypothetical protein